MSETVDSKPVEAAKTTGSPDDLLTVTELADRFHRQKAVVSNLLHGVAHAAMRGKRKLWRARDVADLLSPLNRAKPRLRDELITEQIRKLKIANDAKARKTWPVERMAAAINTCGTKVKSILRQRLENEYPAVLGGPQVAVARSLGKRVVDEVLTEFAALSEHWKEPQAGEPEQTKQGKPRGKYGRRPPMRKTGPKPKSSQAV